MTIKIFIGNLDSNTTADKLRPLFEKYGDVAECDVLKNFGFVHMTDKDSANKAIASLNGYSIDGANMRVELSTGKRGSGGGGGKFGKRGPMGGPGGPGGPRSRPYGPPPPRDSRDFGRPYPPLPPPGMDRMERDPYFHYIMDREAFYARLSRDRDFPLPGPRDRLPLSGARDLPLSGARDRLPLPRDLDDGYPDPRDRFLPPPRSLLDERSRGLGPASDSFFRERDPIASRPPPEFYDRKSMAGGRGDLIGAAGASGGRGGSGMGNGDFYRDRPGSNRVGATGGMGASGNSGDFLGRSNGAHNGYGRPSGPGGGKPGDSQSSFASDPIFF